MYQKFNLIENYFFTNPQIKSLVNTVNSKKIYDKV